MERHFVSLFIVIFLLVTKGFGFIFLGSISFDMTWKTDNLGFSYTNLINIPSISGTPIIAIPMCTNLTLPLAGATHVPTGTDMAWNPVSNATGYKLTVGTSSGSGNILNAIDVGNRSNYNLNVNLPENITIYVGITPYNPDGDALVCTEESFTTRDSTLVPGCTSLLLPLAGATNVPVDTGLSWRPISDATGYILVLETFTEGTDILNSFDLGNVTSYIIPADLPDNKTIYITIVPYNLDGEAVGCPEETFTTGLAGVVIPPKFFTPNNDNINDFWIVSNPLNKVLSVSIYDRHGKLLKQLGDLSLGWDGTFNGSAMPTSDYWYQIIYKDGNLLNGHFSLVR